MPALLGAAANSRNPIVVMVEGRGLSLGQRVDAKHAELPYLSAPLARRK